MHNVHAYIRASLHTDIGTYIHMYVNTYIRTYIHTYIPATCLHAVFTRRNTDREAQTNLHLHLPTWTPLCMCTYTWTWVCIDRYTGSYRRQEIPLIFKTPLRMKGVKVRDPFSEGLQRFEQLVGWFVTEGVTCGLFGCFLCADFV